MILQIELKMFGANCSNQLILNKFKNRLLTALKKLLPRELRRLNCNKIVFNVVYLQLRQRK